MSYVILLLYVSGAKNNKTQDSVLTTFISSDLGGGGLAVRTAGEFTRDVHV